MLVFSTPLVNYRPLTFTLVHLTSHLTCSGTGKSLIRIEILFDYITFPVGFDTDTMESSGLIIKSLYKL
jgi:hypothetical protein